MKTVNFDHDKWPASTAIVNLFFSHIDIKWTDQECVNSLDAFVHSKIDRRRHDGVLLSRPQKEEIESVVGKLLEQFPKIRVDVADSPLIWLRFAFQAMMQGIRPSENCLKCYARWREQRAKEHGVERVYPKAIGVQRRKAELIVLHPKREGISCTIDRFLLDCKLRAEPGSGVIWELRSAKSKSAAVTPTVKKSGYKSRNSGKSEHRDIRETVGVNAYKLVGECVEEAALEPLKSHVKKKNKTGRYESDLSRVELVALLRKHYTDLSNYSPSTISRALPDFVACPNFRRKKIAGSQPKNG